MIEYGFVSKYEDEEEHWLNANSEEEAINKFIDMYYEKYPYIEDYINDICINGSAAERFYRDDEGHMFEFDETAKKVFIRKDIRYKYNNNLIMCYEYIDEVFIRNVKEFFKYDELLSEQYLIKGLEDKDFEFSERMYKYFIKHLILHDYEIVSAGVI
ncbi:hypothetical protein [Priestia koreensis]|uniref:Uncharacterized protein n=1 Tax=Priestia koreensis TaxID=284581 RepID=A0A0M0L6W5_9BACI|nr:hypothetical protein [Priestia koreensis]KOO46408.1 hypothetical protein AMD01_11285 [Priestia koreensis]